MTAPRTTIDAAVREHVRAGDSLHLVVGHSRWSAAAREVVRQWWQRDPGFELVMLSLSSLGAAFFRGGLVRRVVTGLVKLHLIVAVLGATADRIFAQPATKTTADAAWFAASLRPAYWRNCRDFRAMRSARYPAKISWPFFSRWALS